MSPRPETCGHMAAEGQQMDSSTGPGTGPGNGLGREIADGMMPDPRTYRSELIRADVASWLGIGLGDAPGGGPATWELSVDGSRVAVTDEPMTDQTAVGWARRMLGEGVVFLPGRIGGGYWVANPDAPTTLTTRSQRATRSTTVAGRGGEQR